MEQGWRWGAGAGCNIVINEYHLDRHHVDIGWCPWRDWFILSQEWLRTRQKSILVRPNRSAGDLRVPRKAARASPPSALPVMNGLQEQIGARGRGDSRAARVAGCRRRTLRPRSPRAAAPPLSARTTTRHALVCLIPQHDRSQNRPRLDRRPRPSRRNSRLGHVQGSTVLQARPRSSPPTRFW